MTDDFLRRSTRALIRLAGGERFVEAYDEMAASSTPRLTRFYDRTVDALSEITQREYGDLRDTEKAAAESLFYEVLSRTSPSDAVAAALGGSQSLSGLLALQTWVHKQRDDLSSSGASYFDALITAASIQMSAMLHDERVHSLVTHAGFTALLREASEMRLQLDGVDAQVGSVLRAQSMAEDAQVRSRVITLYRGPELPQTLRFEKLTVEISNNTTVAQFLDSIWVHIRNDVPPYTYGTRWYLCEIDKGDRFAVLSTYHSEDRPDDRPLRDVLKNWPALELRFGHEDELLGRVDQVGLDPDQGCGEGQGGSVGAGGLV